MRLFLIIYTLAGPTLAGIAIIVALSTGMVGARPIIAATVIGALAALPASWIVARRLAAAG